MSTIENDWKILPYSETVCCWKKCIHIEFQQDIFDKKGAGATVADKYASTMQYQLYDKYQDVFDIYDKIMAAIINND